MREEIQKNLLFVKLIPKTLIFTYSIIKLLLPGLFSPKTFIHKKLSNIE